MKRKSQVLAIRPCFSPRCFTFAGRARRYVLPSPHHVAGGGPVGTEAQSRRPHRRIQVEEKQHAKEVAKSAYLPTIRNDSNFIHITDTQLIQIDAGSLGTVAGTLFLLQIRSSTRVGVI